MLKTGRSLSIINIAWVHAPTLTSGGLAEILEGQTRLLVPASSLSARVPPKRPAFFNPAAKFSRDLSIVVYRAFVSRQKGGCTFGDAFAGVGSRGIRVAKEVPGVALVYLNDVNPQAIAIARESSILNGVEPNCRFSINEVCKFLQGGTETEERFSIVDLDPFGTPARHLDCVLRSVSDGGLMSITATDTAVLAGIYPEVCRRRYYGRPLNSEYGNEVALRLVISLIAFTGSRLDLGIRPVFCHAFQHYMRVYATLSVSNTAANKILENIGFITHCFSCGYRAMSKNDCALKCPLCDRNLTIAGPLWTGAIYDSDTISAMSSQELDSHCSKVIAASTGELPDIPYYYKVDEIAKRLRTNPVSVRRLIDTLRVNGFRASPTALDPSGFKTTARLDEILGVLK